MARLTRSVQHTLILLLALASLGLAACRPEPVLEEGWVPAQDGSPMWVTYEIETADGIAVYQDDMVFRLDQLRTYQQAVEDGTLPFPLPDPEPSDDPVPYFLPEFGSTWPDAEVPYDEGSIEPFEDRCMVCSQATCDLDSNGMLDAGETCDETQADWIRDAITHWNDNTGFLIRPRDSGDDYWFRFVTANNGCRSDVGNKDGWLPNWVPGADDPQRIWLAPNCGEGTIIHEIGHTLGIRHEQARDDRNAYVIVYEDDIQDDKKHNFDKQGAGFGEYDYRSIMHYGARDFGIRDAAGVRQTTIEPLIPLPSGIMGQRTQGLSKIDVAGANRLARVATGGSRGASERLHYDGFGGSFPGSGALPERVELGYVNADDRPDLIGFRKSGEVIVAPGVGPGSFGSHWTGHANACGPDRRCTLGDFDGDGLTDLANYDPMGSDLIVHLNESDAFRISSLWAVTGRIPGAELHAGDLNGDCLDDVVWVDFLPTLDGDGTVRVYVGLSGGFGTTPPSLWHETFGVSVVAVEDIDGDARADLLLEDQHGSVFLHPSTGTGFGAPVELAHRFCRGGTCKVADLNGDDWLDLLRERPEQHHFLLRLEAAHYDGNVFRDDLTSYHELDCQTPTGCLYVDWDGQPGDDVIEPLATEAGYPETGDRVYRIANGFRRGGPGAIPFVNPAQCTPGPPPPAASPWQETSDIPFIDVVGGRYDTYGVAENLRVYRRTGTDSWVATAGSANPLVGTAYGIYARSNSGRIYERSNDSTWREIGRGSQRLFAGHSGLFNVNASNEVWGYNTSLHGTYRPGWTQLSSGYSSYQYAVGGWWSTGGGWDAGTQEPLLVRRAVGSWAGTHKFDFSTGTWESIRGFSYFEDFVAAGGQRVFVRDDEGHIEVWTGAKEYYAGISRYKWTDVGDFGAQIAVDPASGTLYRLNDAKTRIERLDGLSASSWTQVGGPAEEIWVARGQLFAKSPASGRIFVLSLN